MICVISWHSTWPIASSVLIFFILHLTCFYLFQFFAAEKAAELFRRHGFDRFLHVVVPPQHRFALSRQDRPAAALAADMAFRQRKSPDALGFADNCPGLE